MLKYPVTLRPDRTHGGYVVTFPDFPEAITQGDTKEDALLQAADALETALDFYFEERRKIPLPSLAKRNQPVVDLPVSTTAKVLLLNEMIVQSIRPVDLARRMNTSPQEINRLTNIRHSTRIDGIERALKAMGKRLEVRVL
jgi:antitoxin HicB